MKHVAQIMMGAWRLRLRQPPASRGARLSKLSLRPHRKNLNPRTLIGVKRCSFKTVFVAIRNRKDFRPAYPGRLLCKCVCGPGSAIPT